MHVHDQISSLMRREQLVDASECELYATLAIDDLVREIAWSRSRLISWAYRCERMQREIDAWRALVQEIRAPTTRKLSRIWRVDDASDDVIQTGGDANVDAS